jgi:glucoside 3-dehydrogenase (cytochrome c) hitch-hiker subunit
MAPEGLNRRNALRAMAVGAASVLWIDNLRAAAEAYAARASFPMPQAAAWAPAVLSERQLATVGVIAELIIPATDTPGARAAQVDRYIDGVLATSAPSDRTRLLDGLAWLDRRSQSLFQRDFVDATANQQTDLLTRLSAEDAARQEEAAGVELFTAMKTLTIAGYYSTEIGLRQELGDDGRMMLARFEGCTHPEHQ